MDRCSASCCARVVNGTKVDEVAGVSVSVTRPNVGTGDVSGAIPAPWVVVEFGLMDMAMISTL